jgi:aminoglycoside phosphotransferase (APT) family kinase protein
VASQSTRAWIDGPSTSAIRDAVRAVVPDLAGAPVELHVALEQIDPIWHRGTAWLGHTHVVKFAWSAEAALELARERVAMLALGGTRFAGWMPTVEATNERPLLIVTRRVEGVPCWGEILPDPNIARDVATALADLHDPRVLSAIRSEGIEPPAPAPQADTDAIRSHLDRFLSPSHLSLVRRWCDWTDRVQASSTGEQVILHGDLHGYNLLVRDGGLRCVLDYDAISVGDHHNDLRYLPGLGSSTSGALAARSSRRRCSLGISGPSSAMRSGDRRLGCRCPTAGRCTIGSRHWSCESPGWRSGGRSIAPKRQGLRDHRLSAS